MLCHGYEPGFAIAADPKRLRFDGWQTVGIGHVVSRRRLAGKLHLMRTRPWRVGQFFDNWLADFS